MSYIFFKKIHRVLVLVIILSTLIMSLTGFVLKYPGLTNIVPLDISFVRDIHNAASPFFGFALFLMMVSGTAMYFYPLFMKRK